MPKVIVIDDDYDAVQSLIILLRINDIEVIGKGFDGKEAVELYKKEKPDAVLLDMLMPQFDGAYAIKNIKKYDPDAKIIVITAYRPDYNFEVMRVASVLDKPYEIVDVVNAISQ